MIYIKILNFALIVTFIFSFNVNALEYKLYGLVQPEFSIFTNGDGKHHQSKNNYSFFTKGNFISYLDERDAKITISAIARYDEKDSERRYIDFQKLKYEQYFENYTFKIGNEIIFWGVNESFNIIDIINQSNLAEDMTGTKKLGQPLLSLAYDNNYGTIDLYLMPYFIERKFPSKNGRPRLALEVDQNSITYESSSKEQKLDFALRYSMVYDDYDIGIAHFYGNNRAPQLNINPSTLKFNPHYTTLSQTSLDIQATKGAWLYKLEALSAKDGNERHLGVAGGFEYTFYGIRDSQSDLGLVIEYSFDDRNSYPFNNDSVAALRWTKNDINSTSLLAGMFIDMRGNSNRFIAEYEQRINNNIKLFIDATFNGSIDSQDFTYAFEEDSVFSIKLARYF